MSGIEKKRMFCVYLEAAPGLTKSVFFRARRRDLAEKRALRKNPGWQLVRTPYPPI